MQALTAHPREDLDPADVAALLHAEDLLVETGADLLGLDDEVLERDLGLSISAGTVSWSGTQEIHRTCQLTMSRALRWDRDRIRPWMELTSPRVPGVTARFFTGVFVATAPDTTADDLDVPTHTVYGIDKLHLLGSKIGDTWAIEPKAGITVGGEVLRLLTAAGYRGLVALDPALFSLPVTGEFVWAAGSGTTWLRAINDLLRAGGCTGAWCDEVGTLRAGLIVPVGQRPVEWVLDAQAPRTLVGPVRRRTADLTKIPNAYRFTAANWDLEPTDGDGAYLPPDNTDTGPTSIVARGRRVLEEIQLDALTQEALVAQADERIASDLRAAGVRSLRVGPLPLLGHHDVVAVTDTNLGDPVVGVATDWTLDLFGADGPLTLEEVA